MGLPRRDDITWLFMARAWFQHWVGWLLALFGGVLLAVTSWFLLSLGRAEVRALATGPLFTMFTVVAAIATGSASLHPRLDRQTRRAWWFFTAALAVICCANLAWLYQAAFVGGAAFLSWVDLVFLSYVPLSLLGLYTFPVTPLSRTEKRIAALDATMVLLSGGMLHWYLALQPALATQSNHSQESIIAILYSLGDLALLFGVTLIVQRRPAEHSRQAINLLAVAALCNASADIFYTSRVLFNGYQDGSWPDVLWLTGIWLVGVAAYLQRLRIEYEPDTSHIPSAHRQPMVLLPYLAVLIGEGILLAASVDEWQSGLGGLILGSVLLTTLAVVRQMITIRANQHLLTLSAEAQRTAREAAETALQESVASLRTIIDNAQQAIVVVDREGVIKLYNALAQSMSSRILGWELRIGQVVSDHLSPSERSWFVQSMQQALHGLTVAVEQALGEPPGQRWYEIYVVPVAQAVNDVNSVLVLVRDTTDRRRAEMERLALERKLLETQKLESLGILAGGIAHDFNNLLTVIMGNASLARLDLETGGPALADINEIEQAAQRAADLTRQMLAFSGRGRFIVQPLDVNALVRELYGFVRSSIPKTIELELALPEQLPLIAVDPSQIQQLIINLITNAAEAIGDVPGTVRLATFVRALDQAFFASTYLSPELPAGTYVCIEIADSGSGMDTATLGRIFDPFFTTRFTGRGLGLAVVLGIVRGHRGAIQVESSVGTGSTFRVFLPALEQGAAP